MKKRQISFDKKLNLDKEVIASLDDQQSASIEGGVGIFSITCNKAAAVEDDQEGNSCIACSCNGAAA